MIDVLELRHPDNAGGRYFIVANRDAKNTWPNATRFGQREAAEDALVNQFSPALWRAMKRLSQQFPAHTRRIRRAALMLARGYAPTPDGNGGWWVPSESYSQGRYHLTHTTLRASRRRVLLCNCPDAIGGAPQDAVHQPWCKHRWLLTLWPRCKPRAG
jgi:hypothetical protein